MRILVEGAGLANKGAEAMLRTVQAELGRRLGPTTFSVEAGNLHPGHVSAAQELGFEIVHCRPTGPKIIKAKRLAKLAAGTPAETLKLWKSRKQILGWDAVLNDVDMVVDVSGFRYSDDIGPIGPRRTAPLISLAAKNGKPYVLMPQSFGPFRHGGEVESICRQSLAQASLLFARDDESRQHLSGLLGRSIEDIPLGADITFNWHPKGVEEGRRILERAGLGMDGRPIVCLSPNVRVYERSEGLSASNTYVKVLVEVCRYFSAMGVDVLVLHHESRPEIRSIDDRFLCDLISLGARADGAAGAGRVAEANQLFKSDEIKATISACDLLIGSRFHAIVAAIHSRVPVVAVGWSHKYVELLKGVGLERFVVGYESAEVEDLRRLIGEAWGNRQALRRQLEERLPAIEADSSRVLDRVVEYVSCRVGTSVPQASPPGDHR